ncbi:tRNA-Thr(GGU) m(6)t(6)A37 methyltransferase TsaA [Methanolinea mesophila]|uniref:tRNA (N6-threonylcarbamoyladenosine(37)-N6)-methyltransferase TrmO n=1 Tax=Methanolinea mesophila TaxID=547055 RepID=UPI001FD7D31F|nr:tRNA (N6-threonylcarbamoyladenosine(37)-N6)-methyltransferase TrmO [Methanolinea mesophila]MBP1927584.1 tRNA-Thr(GGU) m(6)t(6)A37 methyltransferase TsaA [Methanolinea mesophila]
MDREDVKNEMNGMQPVTFTLRPIGVVRSPYHSMRDAPRQGRLSPGVLSKIAIFEEFRPGVGDLGGVRHIIVLYWLDRAERDLLHATPPGTTTEKPVFATRSPNRPNPIGLCVVEVMKISEGCITVAGLDALDMTPVLDIKPYSPGIDAITCDGPGQNTPNQAM